MIHIDASGLSYQQLNEKIRSCQGDVFLENCCGQRFLGTGMRKTHPHPGNPRQRPGSLPQRCQH